jgi:outer membrane protein TolC
MQCSWLTAAGAAAVLIVLGFVPRVNAQQPRRLTLKEAIELGLRSNISVLSSAASAREAAGTGERRMSNLLPKSYVQTSYTLEKIDLAELGIDIPFVKPGVGPFAAYDLRVYLSQPILDLQAFHNWKSSESHQEAMRNDYQNSRDLVIQTVASLYLNAESAAALVDSAQSRVTLSEALSKLANDQHEAGVATGLDVLRAKVQLADDQQALLVAKNTAQQALLVLSRNIGLEVGTPLELAETLNYQPIDPPALREAISEALANRPDYSSLRQQRDEQVELQKASRARSLPQISLSANYGAAGRSISGITTVGAVEGILKWNIFDRDRGGEAREVDSRVERLDSQLTDLTLQIEEDVQEALLNLDSANNEVRVAQAGLTLAQQELDLARVTFQAGATNNIEVTTAQDSLSRAQQNLVTALTRHVDAKIALARALGGTEKNYERFLEPNRRTESNNR